MTVHAADNSFGKWPAYNEMIGIGGWGGRNEKSGPYLYWDEKAKKVIKDITAGKGGSHGAQHEFLVEVREPQHPIVKGLPMKWLHAQDELYDRLRGPAKDVSVLATAFADPKTRGSGRHEPTLMTISYGKGRVFHTTLGHADYSMLCQGFFDTLLRGSEWVSGEDVTVNWSKEFPGKDKAVPVKAAK